MRACTRPKMCGFLLKVCEQSYPTNGKFNLNKMKTCSSKHAGILLEKITETVHEISEFDKYMYVMVQTKLAQKHFLVYLV